MQGATNPGSTLDYYALLGVSRDANQDEIEARYQELMDHMASNAVPPSLREWANRETALLDEAYAVLSDPERRTALAPAADGAGAASLRVAVQAPPAKTPEEPVARVRAQAAPVERPASALQALFHGVPWTLAAMGVSVGVVVLGFILFGSDLLSGRGGGAEAPAAAAQENGLAAIDTERVAELMTLVQEDPNNVEALFELGETYFLGGEWQAAIDWFTKLLELDPGNVHARTDVGTANFNLGRYEEAKASWLAGLENAPDDVQLHYNMGFLYANVDPVDFESAQSEWSKVVELAPGSDLAATAQVHLDSLTAQPSAAATTEAPAAATP
jgi:tetratricopeptide (TPR) repeat protein